METEHGLGNVTGEFMLNTLLNHWIKCYGKPNIVRTDKEGAFRDQGFRVVLMTRVYVLTLILVTRPGKQECFGKHWIPSSSQQYVWARRTPDSVAFQEIFDELHDCSQ